MRSEEGRLERMRSEISDVSSEEAKIRENRGELREVSRVEKGR